jgi:undecaprenyl diphosphate synthase
MDKNNLKIPHHLGIIIDGNRRWAREKGLPVFEGHRRGFENFKKIADYAFGKGVRILTIFAFSTENWNRTKIEVNYLMKLLGIALGKKYIKELNQKDVRLKVIGQKERLSNSLQEKIKKIEEATKINKKGILILAISYGGRQEIIQAVQGIIKDKIPGNKISEELISKNLWTSGLPDPDLIIRTGGEQRLSGFLTWQSVYSELCFIKKYWPEFSEKDLDIAFEEYNHRQRRFGK